MDLASFSHLIRNFGSTRISHLERPFSSRSLVMSYQSSRLNLRIFYSFVDYESKSMIYVVFDWKCLIRAASQVFLIRQHRSDRLIIRPSDEPCRLIDNLSMIDWLIKMRLIGGLISHRKKLFLTFAIQPESLYSPRCTQTVPGHFGRRRQVTFICRWSLIPTR